MNVKKQVAEKITAMLEAEQMKIKYRMIDNRRDINRLAEENAVLKRQRAALTTLIYEWKGKA